VSLALGIDFGTASVRAAMFDSERGRLGVGVAQYEVLRRPEDADFAAQRHADHCKALELAVRAAVSRAGVDGKNVKALAVATTGSTIVPVDEGLNPLDDYYLWCDHRAWREAAEITCKARAQHLAALDWSGGTYSSEWGFAKLLHWLRANPDPRAQFCTSLEHCDLIVSMLCGICDPHQVPRSICAMGHKWMWNSKLGGLPPKEFLESIDPLFCGLRERLCGRYLPSNRIAGGLCDEWAFRLGLRAGIPIPVGALDAHWDAIGSGCRLTDITNVVGTSACIMAIADQPRLIPGVSGVVQGSIHPDKVGIEAGLSAVGDLFDAISRRAGSTTAAMMANLENYRAGQTGLMRVAWDNGDRSILVNPRLRGITVGWRLNHTAEDELFAAIEGTAFHTRIIFERLQEYGVPIVRVINAGGIPPRNDALNRIYAAVLAKPVLVPTTDTTGTGAAIFAFLAAGVFRSVEDAQDALCPPYRVVEPNAQDARIYERLFAQFHELYLSMGARDWRPGDA
jgi:L-ribulokinase